ncbi:MAG: undecaprenyldiphospho-muramoylpentapeptide beta-N-acetylglucosaminyltransferase [Alphaproteobacteria bacterium]|nr:undecaprenyldiphospho-muramoylpentapeptide beta-N-acetylglucosaminyltransferase [Alphaproteobacteria bacterium]
MDDRSELILLSAGGTGGHMFPAQALASDLLSRGYLVVLATDQRGKKFENQFKGVDVHVLSAGTIGGGVLGRIKGAGALAVGIAQGYKLVRRMKPRVVVGFGGYPSYPAVFVAQKMEIPTVIHEQNAILGRANAMLAPKADRIAVSYADVYGLQEADAVRTVVTGNPVRGDIAALYTRPYASMRPDGPLNILVVGGSLGAAVFSHVVPKALSSLHSAYRARLRVMQQCRPENVDTTRAVYAEAGIEATISPFFENMAELLGWSHLVISRSGASSVAEITAAGRPAIFVPYPHHADHQQKINADHVSDSGGAWTMTEEGFTPEALMARIETFLQNPQSLFRAAESARDCGRPDAARRLGNLVTALASGWDKQEQKNFDLTQGREDF